MGAPTDNGMPSMAGAAIDLPAGFALGVATSSFQIEGAVDVDGRGPSIWDTFTAVPGAVARGDDGAVACDHYHRLEEDLDLLAWLGVDRYRFSIAWPRILPDADRTEPRGLDFYDRLVDGLLARGIRPLATLYHWDLPQVLEDAGGWSERATVDAFARYAEVVGQRLGDRVHDWSTLNEPWCSAFLGYHTGVHAPGVRDPRRAIAAVHHLLLAHGVGSEVLRAAAPDEVRVGIVLNPAPVRPASDRAEDLDAAHLADGLRNRVWLDPLLRGRYPEDVLAVWEPITDLGALHRQGDLERIAAPLDLLGVNYYRPHVVGSADHHDGEPPPGPGQAGIVELPDHAPTTALGWHIDPSGLEELLLRLGRDAPHVPLAVTENGGAFPDAVAADGTVDDTDRIAYLEGHLRAAARVVAARVDLRAYFVWTLLDNFEWAEGYAPTFGIVHVDRATQRRTPKRSAGWYRELLASRAATEGPGG
jgi:beta-glucosidase